jgi:hypothetical protein
MGATYPLATTSLPTTGRVTLAANEQKALSDATWHPGAPKGMRGFVAVVVSGSVVFGRNDGALSASRDFPRTAGQPIEDPTASSLAFWAVKEAVGGAAEIAIILTEVP